MPIGRVPGEAADFEPEHDAGAAEADFGDELLIARAIRGARAQLALIAVDGDDPVARPAEGDRAPFGYAERHQEEQGSDRKMPTQS